MTPNDENKSEPRLCTPGVASNRRDSVSLLAVELAPDLDAITNRRGAILAESAARSGSPLPGNRIELKGCFAIHTWHRTYAEALMETDAAKLRLLIAEAEEAILARYLQLSDSPLPTDETLDLLNAIDALANLRTATNANPEQPQ
jgi:hypothetical protein